LSRARISRLFWLRRVFRNDLENFEAAALSDNSEIEEFRLLRRSRLGLKVPNDPGKLLHHALAVLGADVTLQVAIDRFVKFLLIN
jgi:hypothetical protein